MLFCLFHAFIYNINTSIDILIQGFTLDILGTEYFNFDEFY